MSSSELSGEALSCQRQYSYQITKPRNTGNTRKPEKAQRNSDSLAPDLPIKQTPVPGREFPRATSTWMFFIRKAQNADAKGKHKGRYEVVPVGPLCCVGPGRKPSDQKSHRAFEERPAWTAAPQQNFALGEAWVWYVHFGAYFFASSRTRFAYCALLDTNIWYASA